MAQQPYFKGIPKKKSLDGILRVDPKAKTEVIKKVVETAKPDINPTGPVAKKYLTKEQREQVAKRAPEVAKKEALKNLTTNVTVPTSYGKAVIQYKGFRALDPDKQRALLDEMRLKIEAAEDAKRKPEERVARTVNPFTETKPVDVDSETKRILGGLESTVLGAMYGKPYQAADKFVQDAKKSNESEPNSIAQIAKGLGLSIAESTLRPASTFEGQVGNMYDPDATAEERLGAIGNAALYVPSVLPGARGAIATAQNIGKQGFKEALKTGLKTFAREAIPFSGKLGKLIDGPRVNDMVPASVRQGIDFNAPRQADPASGVVTPPEPHFTAGYEPTGVTPITDSFADQQRATLRDVLGADDVSGVVPEPMAAVKPKATKAKDWELTSTEFYKKNPVLYHGGPELVGENLTRGGKNGFDMGGIFFTDSRKYAEQYAKPNIYESRKSDVAKNIFDPQKESHIKKLREGFLQRWREGEYDTAEDAIRDYEQVAKMDLSDWATGSQYGEEIEKAGFDGAKFRERPGEIRLDANGRPEVVPGSKPVYSIASFGNNIRARKSLHRSIIEDALNAGEPVPQKVLDEYPDLKPLQPQPTAVEPPTPVDMAPTPKIADMTPKEPSVPTVTATVDAPQNVTGISNAANLSDFEQGILSSAPEGKGRSVKEIYETNRNRKDYDNVADRVSKGEALTADNAAAILAGKAEYTAKVRSAKDAIEQGIIDGVSEADMFGRRKALDDAIEAATEYAEKIQRGKSEWSDVGRTLAAYLDVDTRDIASVLQEARIRKGAALTAEEIAKREAEVKALTDLLDESKAEIARLMKAHADNATKVAAARKIVRTPEARAAKRKQALDEFFAASAGLNAYVNPKAIKQFAKYMYTLIEDGARSVDDIVAAAAKDGVKADYEDVYAAMRSQVKESTLSDLQKEIAKTKRELMAAAKADDPNTVLPGRRQMTTEQKIRFREGALRNEIVKLDKQIEQKKRFPKGAKIESPEIKRLDAIRKEKQATLDEITKPQKEAKAATDRAAVIQSQIVKLLEQAEDGTLPAPKKREIDDQIKALEIERRKALKAAQDASPEYQAAKDARLKQANKKRLEEKLKALEDRIANKDYAEVSIVKNARRTDDELNKLRQKIRVKESMVKAGIEAMRPRTAADNVGTYLNEIKLWNVGSRVADLTANAVKFADFNVSSIPRRITDTITSKYLDEIPLTKGTNADRTARIFNQSRERLKADAELILRGGDADSVKKYGSSWIGGKAAGLTDVPFKSFYYEWMSDLAADVKARKKLGNNASPEAIATEREAILASIDEHPDIQLMAEEYSLNQTLNNPNWASKTVGFWKKGASGAGKVAIDEFLGRFAKVITNVAIDATDRSGIGIVRGALKVRNAKKLGQSLTTSERAIINDMITKGFTGIATLTAGYYLGDKVIGTIKGERNKYIDYGDAEKIGGPMSAFLLGATLRKAESIKDPKEANTLRMRTIANLPLNTPLASNAKDVLELASEMDEKTLSKYAARKVVGLIPIASQSRDIAERMDTQYGIKTGAEVERDKMPKEISAKTGNEIQTSNFFKILEADFKSKVPGLRQTLPIKKSDADKKKEKAEAAAKKKLDLLK